MLEFIQKFDAENQHKFMQFSVICSPL